MVQIDFSEAFDMVRDGGLGLSHLFLKQVVSRFLFLRDQQNPFIRTIIQVITIYGEGSGRDVLKRVKKMLVPPGVKTFFFKLHTGTLPVKTWLEQRGMFVPWGVNCLLCNKPETVEHISLL
ncbi:uncharacterized protein LOC125759987 [Rhipicephalus sanguineus]|uniref:uncharacterized protein LOC125759987 n=1 Tax=Rhipicephalus sanguineus TaxID=34632 RepID=UPI0020C5789F|nr:uncharacterized protein LOC125759987 [Rhipicephalus sanguineus]